MLALARAVGAGSGPAQHFDCLEEQALRGTDWPQDDYRDK